jgi:hypothetical protein
LHIGCDREFLIQEVRTRPYAGIQAGRTAVQGACRCGTYDDIFRKVGGAWKIASRRATMINVNVTRVEQSVRATEEA